MMRFDSLAGTVYAVTLCACTGAGAANADAAGSAGAGSTGSTKELCAATRFRGRSLKRPAQIPTLHPP